MFLEVTLLNQKKNTINRKQYNKSSNSTLWYLKVTEKIVTGRI